MCKSYTIYGLFRKHLFHWQLRLADGSSCSLNVFLIRLQTIFGIFCQSKFCLPNDCALFLIKICRFLGYNVLEELKCSSSINIQNQRKFQCFQIMFPNTSYINEYPGPHESSALLCQLIKETLAICHQEVTALVIYHCHQKKLASCNTNRNCSVLPLRLLLLLFLSFFFCYARTTPFDLKHALYGSV